VSAAERTIIRALPAQPGWYAKYIDPDGGVDREAVAAWAEVAVGAYLEDEQVEIVGLIAIEGCAQLSLVETDGDFRGYVFDLNGMS
jgi:hypothetical protein